MNKEEKKCICEMNEDKWMFWNCPVHGEKSIYSSNSVSPDNKVRCKKGWFWCPCKEECGQLKKTP